MPAKSRARAASVKPPSKKVLEPLQKSSRTPASKKRAATERPASPPPKRTKADEKLNDSTNEDVPSNKRLLKKPRSRTLAHNRTALTSVPEQKPYFNPLPVPPEHHRPGLQLFVWGAGNCGQFGLGPDVLDEISTPKRQTWVEEQMQKGTFGEVGAGLESIAAGGMHTLFIDEKGTIWSCGVNDDAALGRITDKVPDPDKPGSYMDIDELTSYPRPLQSLIDENFRATQVVAGDNICAAVNDKGDVRAWGSFRVNEGSLGFSSERKHQFLPVPILQLSHKPGDIEKVSSIASGANHLLVLTTHGNIYTWGASEQSQLGRKILERRKIHGTVPEKIALGTRSRKAKAVGAGIYHSFAVDEDGDVWGWGLNSMGQTGTGYYSQDDSIVQLPTKVERLSKAELDGDQVVQIAGGEHHTLFLTAGGRVYACGRSNCGQLGLPDDAEAFQGRIEPDFLPEPVMVPFPDKDDPIVHISVGLHNNMAITKAGALYSWGQGTQSELGVSDVEVKTPRIIVRKEGGTWAAVQTSCGGQHTLGLFRKKK